MAMQEQKKYYHASFLHQLQVQQNLIPNPHPLPHPSAYKLWRSVNLCPAEYIKMPCLLLIFSQSEFLIRIVAINLHTWWQTVQIKISCQLIWIYTVCKGRIYPGSAGQGLKLFYDCHINTSSSYTKEGSTGARNIFSWVTHKTYWILHIFYFMIFLHFFSQGRQSHCFVYYNLNKVIRPSCQALFSVEKIIPFLTLKVLNHNCSKHYFALFYEMPSVIFSEKKREKSRNRMSSATTLLSALRIKMLCSNIFVNFQRSQLICNTEKYYTNL